MPPLPHDQGQIVASSRAMFGGRRDTNGGSGQGGGPRSSSQPSSSLALKKSKTSSAMLENASAEELSVLVLTIQDEYAKLSKEKASSDEAAGKLSSRYGEARDQISILSNRIYDLEHDNEDVRSTMDTLSSEFEKSTSTIAVVERMKADSDAALAAAEAQTVAMREALVTEIARLTSDSARTKDDLDHATADRDDLALRGEALERDLTLARREFERARLDSSMTREDAERSLAESTARLGGERDDAVRTRDALRRDSDRLARDRDDARLESEGRREDSEAAARSYEAAISELKSRLETVSNQRERESGDLQRERDDTRRARRDAERERDDAAQRADAAERARDDADRTAKDARLDGDAMREEYESRIEDVTAELDRAGDDSDRRVGDAESERDEQRLRAAKLSSELGEARKYTADLEAEATDLQETIEAMDQNMAAVRNDFGTRIERAQEEAQNKDDGHDALVREVQEKLDAVTLDGSEARRDLQAVRRRAEALERDAEEKEARVETAEKDRATARELYEGRIDRLVNEMAEAKNRQGEESVELGKEVEELQQSLEEAGSEKRTAEYRIRRLEEEVESGREFGERMKKDAEDSRGEYEHVMENLMEKMRDAKEEADAKYGEVAEESERARIEAIKLGSEKRDADARIERLEASLDESEAHRDRLQSDLDDTIKSYEAKIDSVSLKYLDKINGLTSERDDAFDNLRSLAAEHELTANLLKVARAEACAAKYSYEQRIQTLEGDLDATTGEMRRRVQGLEADLDALHEERDTLTTEKKILTGRLGLTESDLEEVNSALGKMTQQLALERDEHEAKVDEVTQNFSQAMEKLMAERKEASERANRLENELAIRADDIDRLSRDAQSERKDLEERINRLHAENENMNRSILQLSSSKKEALDKIRGLEEEVSDADGAIDDAKSAIETLLAEKQATDHRIDELKAERAEADENTEQLRRQMAMNKKDLELRINKVQAESDESNHSVLVLRMEKKDALEKVSNLERDISQAEIAIGDAKKALQKLLTDKDEAKRRIEGLEDDAEHAQATIEAMTKSMTHAREEYESKIDNLMKGLNTAREVHASRASAAAATTSVAMSPGGVAESNRGMAQWNAGSGGGYGSSSGVGAGGYRAAAGGASNNATLPGNPLKKDGSFHSSPAVVARTAGDRAGMGKGPKSALNEGRALLRGGGGGDRPSIPSSSSGGSGGGKARNKAMTSSGFGIESSHHLKSSEAMAGKNELSVDLDNMTISSELTDDQYGTARAMDSGGGAMTARTNTANKYLLPTPEQNVVPRYSSSLAIENHASALSSSRSNKVLSNLDLARSLMSSKPGSGNAPSPRAVETDSRGRGRTSGVEPSSSSVARPASRPRTSSRSRPRPQSSNSSVAYDAPDSRSVSGASSLYSSGGGVVRGNFGGQYEGDVNSRGERHGYGVFVAENRNEYEGEWKNDMREGHGKAKYNTGDLYIGSWKNCKRHGHGTMYIENGDIYEGGWQNGFKDGSGTYRWKDGEVDISRYSSDYRVGEGVRWSEDRRRAFRLHRGNVKEEITLGDAEHIADSLGLPSR